MPKDIKISKEIEKTQNKVQNQIHNSRYFSWVFGFPFPFPICNPKRRKWLLIIFSSCFLVTILTTDVSSFNLEFHVDGNTSVQRNAMVSNGSIKVGKNNDQVWLLWNN